jgi:hypothetical protein
LSAKSDPQARAVRLIRVAVHNDSGNVLRPRFATNHVGQASAFWTVAGGPPSLAPGAGAVYVLTMGDESSMPFNGTPFLLQAVTESPATISSSRLFVQSGPTPGRW